MTEPVREALEEERGSLKLSGDVGALSDTDAAGCDDPAFLAPCVARTLRVQIPNHYCSMLHAKYIRPKLPKPQYLMRFRVWGYGFAFRANS